MNETSINRLRLWSGLTMLGYVAAHLINLALGLVSVAAMNAMLAVVIGFWGHWSVQIVLGSSILVHFALAMRALWRRRSLRMPPAEALQMFLGCLIPFMLALHISKTRVAQTAYGMHIDYTYELLQFWVLDRTAGAEQALLLVVAWTHACIGINFNLKLRRWYPAAKPLLLIAAVSVPMLAVLGYARAGYEIMALAQDPSWIAHIQQVAGAVGATPARLLHVAFVLRVVVFGLIAAVLLARLLRRIAMRRHGMVTLNYSNGRRIRIVRGTSVLEASRDAAVPHMSICGGRGRCSTCRTRIAGDLSDIPPPSDFEQSVLARMNLPDNVRLACQLRPHCDMIVTPLLTPGNARRAMAHGLQSGSECEITIMFCDLRGFTALAEHRLPYDTVFLLNCYFAEMGQAIEAAGGRLDKFIGDGVMALFGTEADARTGARQALEAAIAMSRRLDRLNKMFAHELAQPLRIGIGLHSGTVILGEMGYGRAMALTAIGDCVNTASRLESLSKDYGVELIVSEEVGALAHIDLSPWDLHELAVRGRKTMLKVHAVTLGRELATAYSRG